MIKIAILTLCLVALLASLIYLVLLILGKKRLYKDYKKDYQRLVMIVNHAIITRRNYCNIQKKFEDIQKYACRNDKQLAELSLVFYQRFHVFKPKK